MLTIRLKFVLAGTYSRERAPHYIPKRKCTLEVVLPDVMPVDANSSSGYAELENLELESDRASKYCIIYLNTLFCSTTTV